MKLINKITQPVLMPNWWQDIFLSLPRIVCGYLLTVEFGASKFGLPWSPDDNNLNLFEVAFWFPNDVAEYGGIFAVLPAFFAWMGAFSEGIGGIMLLLGFQTRIASFLIISTMLVAMFMQQWQQGMWNMLPAMGFLWIGMFYLILGSGRFGMDYLLTKKKSEIMKSVAVVVLFIISSLMSSCVQKTYKRTIVVTLDVSKVENIESVGIRGNGEPLSWDTDFPMQELVKDSLYKAIITTETGYLFAEGKCTVNGNFELNNQPNRRIAFDTTKDTTFVDFVFNQE